MGVDAIWFKTAQVYDFENDPNELIPVNAKYSRYKKTSTGTQFKGNLTNHCWRLWHDPVITWDGLVAPCCFDKDADHKMGNLQEQTFRELWQSEPYAAFRASVLRSRSEIEMCKNCTEGTKVWG